MHLTPNSHEQPKSYKKLSNQQNLLLVNPMRSKTFMNRRSLEKIWDFLKKIEKKLKKVFQFEGLGQK